MRVFTVKALVRVVRTKNETDHRYDHMEGATKHWGFQIGMEDGSPLVKFTDSDNKVKIKKFNINEVV